MTPNLGVNMPSIVPTRASGRGLLVLMTYPHPMIDHWGNAVIEAHKPASTALYTMTAENAHQLFEAVCSIRDKAIISLLNDSYHTV